VATPIHPRVATAATSAVRRRVAVSVPPAERLAVIGSLVVATAGLVIVAVVELAATGVRSAAVGAALAGLLAVLGWQSARQVVRHRRERRHAAVGARTADELDRLAGERWTVRHGVPIGDGHTAHLVADGAEIHLLLAVWVPPRDAALHLRCAVATANRAARELRTMELEHGHDRPVITRVVAWGRAADPARAGQTAATADAVLLPGELWSWRIARARTPAAAAGPRRP
jgi:hypothetical protein